MDKIRYYPGNRVLLKKNIDYPGSKSLSILDTLVETTFHVLVEGNKSDNVTVRICCTV